MDLPFSSFELTFILIAFFVLTLFILASVCIQPQPDHPEAMKLKKKNLRLVNKLETISTQLFCVIYCVTL
uniref:Uncharacterized protein n=1 Tax=Gouania willdenowi TaxID=441366 RepID=A0A8C5HCJ5_GOUWI